MRAVDLTGQRFGRLLVKQYVGRTIIGGKMRRTYVARCDCGNEKSVSGESLNYGRTNSCGCLRTEMIVARSTKHGSAGRGLQTPEYRCWKGMIARCHNPRIPNYANYGGRGIVVCDAWRASFAAFYAHVGPKPTNKHSIDRTNNDGSYEPGNVRWATQQEQQRNRRDSRIIEVGGDGATLAEWAGRVGLRPGCIQNRLKRGWSGEQAVVASLDPRGGHSGDRFRPDAVALARSWAREFRRRASRWFARAA